MWIFDCRSSSQCVNAAISEEAAAHSRPFQSHHRLLSSLAFMGWEIGDFSSHRVEIANQDHILWHRNTHNCTENLSHWMFCMLYPSQKKDQNCLPPNLFINSSILQPSTQTVAGSGSFKTISRQVSASNRERPSTSRIFLSLAPSERQFNMFSKGRWPVPLHNFINGHYLQSDRWTMWWSVIQEGQPQHLRGKIFITFLTCQYLPPGPL